MELFREEKSVIGGDLEVDKITIEDVEGHETFAAIEHRLDERGI